MEQLKQQIESPDETLEDVNADVEEFERSLHEPEPGGKACHLCGKEFKTVAGAARHVARKTCQTGKKEESPQSAVMFPAAIGHYVAITSLSIIGKVFEHQTGKAMEIPAGVMPGLDGKKDVTFIQRLGEAKLLLMNKYLAKHAGAISDFAPMVLCYLELAAYNGMLSGGEKDGGKKTV